MAIYTDEYVSKMKLDISDFSEKIGMVDSLIKGITKNNKEVPTFIKEMVPGLVGLKDTLSAAKNELNKLSTSEPVNEVDRLTNSFKVLDTVVFSVINNISNRLVNFGLHTLREMSIAPVLEGFQEYENQINSTQTIMANTGRSVTDVTNALDDLNTYADLTIYNFSQMTSNAAMFTAAIGKTSPDALEKSTQAIKGIGNWAATAGANASDMARATYQLGQALSQGSIRLMDWRSLENTGGMAGANFQNAFFEAFKTLHPENADAVQQLINTKSFRESLSEGWLTNDVFFEAMKNFANDQSMVDNATKIKTFTQLLGTLKEQLGTGWGSAFRVIFGDFEQAKSLWTSIGDVLLKNIGDMNQYRYEFLKTWSDLGGRTALFQGLTNIFETLGALLGKCKQAFQELFPAMTAQQLFDVTLQFQQFTEKIKLSNEALNTFGIACNVAMTIVKFFVGVVKDLFSGLRYIFQPIFAVVKSFLAYIPLIVNGMDTFKTTLNGFNIFSTIGKQIANILTIISSKIVSFNTTIQQTRNITGQTRNIIEAFTNIFNNFQGFVNGFTTAVGQMFSDFVGFILNLTGALLNNIKQIFNLEPIIDFINRLLSALSGTSGLEGALNIIDRIFMAFGNISKNIFRTVTDIDSLNTVLSYLLSWLQQLASVIIYGNIIRIFSNINNIFSGMASVLKFQKFNAYVDSISKMAIALTGLGNTMRSLATLDTSKIFAVTASLSALLLVMGKITQGMQTRAYKYGLDKAALNIRNEAESSSQLLNIAKETIFHSISSIFDEIQNLLVSVNPILKFGTYFFIISQSIKQILNIFKDILDTVKSMADMNPQQTLANVGIILGVVTTLIGELYLLSKAISASDIPVEAFINMSIVLIAFSGMYKTIASSVAAIAQNDITQMIASAISITGAMTVLILVLRDFLKNTDVAFFNLDFGSFAGFSVFFVALSITIRSIAAAIAQASAIGDIPTLITAGVVICGAFVAIILATKQLVTQMSNNYVGTEKVEGLYKFAISLGILFAAFKLLANAIRDFIGIPWEAYAQVFIFMAGFFVGLYFLLQKMVEITAINVNFGFMAKDLLAMIPMFIAAIVIMKTIRQLAEIPWQQLAAAVGAFAVAIVSIGGSLYALSRIRLNADSLGALSGIIFALQGLGGLIKTLSEINTGDLFIAIGGFAAILAVIDAFYYFLNKIRAMRGASEAASQNRLIKLGIQFAGIAALIAALGIAISKMYKALVVLSTVPTDRLIASTTVVIVVIGAMIGVAKAIEAIPFEGGNGIKKQLATIGILIAGLLPLAAAMRMLATIEIEDSGRIIVALLSLVGGLVPLFAGIFALSKFTKDMKSIETFALISAVILAIVSAAKIAASMSADDVGNAILTMTSLVGFVAILAVVLEKVQVVSGAMEHIAGIITKFAKVFVAAFGVLVTAMGIVGQFGGEEVANQLLLFFDSIAGQQDRIRNGISTVIDGLLNGVIDGIRNSLGNFIDLLGSLFVEIANKITQMDPVAQIVAGVLTGVVIGIIVAVKTVGNVIDGGAFAALGKLTAFFAGAEAAVGLLVAEAIAIAGLLGQLLQVPFIRDGIEGIAKTIGMFQGAMEGARLAASADGLNTFARKVAGISKYEHQIDIAKSLLNDVSDAFDKLSRSSLLNLNIGEILNKMAQYVNSLVDCVKQMSSDAVDMDGIMKFLMALKTMTDILSSIQISSNVSDLDAFLSSLGQRWTGALTGFFENINHIKINEAQIEKVSSAITTIMNALTSIQIQSRPEDVDAFISSLGMRWTGALTGFMEEIAKIKINETNVKSFANGLSAFFDSMAKISIPDNNPAGIDAYVSSIGQRWTGSLTHLFEEVNDIKVNETNLTSFTTGLKAFFDAMSTVSIPNNDVSGMDAYISSLGTRWVGALTGLFEDMSGTTWNSENVSSFTTGLKAFFEAMSSITIPNNDVSGMDAYVSSLGDRWVGALTGLFEDMSNTTWNSENITSFTTGLKAFFEAMSSITIPSEGINALDAYVAAIGTNWTGALTGFMEDIMGTAWNTENISSFTTGLKAFFDAMSSITIPAEGVNALDAYVSAIGTNWTGALTGFMEDINGTTWNSENITAFTTGLKAFLEAMSSITIPADGVNAIDAYISAIGTNWTGALTGFMEEISNTAWNSENISSFATGLKAFLDAMSSITIPSEGVNALDAYISAIGTNWTGALTGFMEEISNTTWNSENLTSFATALKSILDALSSISIPDISENALSNLAEDAINMINKFTTFVASYDNINLGERLTEIAEAISTFLSKLNDVYNGESTVTIKSILDDVILDGIEESINSAKSQLNDGGTQLMQELQNGMDSKHQDVIGSADTILTAIGDLITGTYYDSMYDWGNGLGDKLSEGITDKKDVIESAVSSILSLSQGIYNSTYQSFESLGQNCGDGLIDGLNSKISAVNAKADELANAAKSAAANAVDAHSPAKEFIKIGQYCGDGFVIGMDDTATKIQNASSRLAKMSINTLRDAIANTSSYSYHPIIQPLFESALDHNVSFTSNVQTMFSKPLNNLSDNLYDLYDRMQTDNAELRGEIEQFRQDVQTMYDSDDSELSLYVDSKKLASTIAKPMNRQLNILRKRGG